MAAYYSLADRSASLTAAGRLGEIRTGSGQRMYIREIGVSVGVAGAAPTVGLIRVNVLGVTPTAAKAAQAEDPAQPASAVTSAVAWGTAPTLPATPIYFRRVGLPATIGAGWVWTWNPGEELVVAVSSAILIDLVAISAAVATAVDWYVKWTE